MQKDTEYYTTGKPTEEVTWLSYVWYKWETVNCSGAAAFHLAAYVCTSSNDKEPTGAD